MMSRRTKHTLLFITYTVLLLTLVMNLELFIPLFLDLASMFMPVFVGIMIAFVLNVPMSGIERGLKRFFEKRGNRELPFRSISLLLTLGALVLVAALVTTMVVPEVAGSFKSLDTVLDQRVPQLIDWLNHQQFDAAGITEFLQGLDLEKISESLLGSASSLVDSVVSVVSSTFSVVSSALISLVLAIYMLLSKEKLSLQVRKLLYAVLRKDLADGLCHVGSLITDTYTKFLGGQCMEACILAVLMFTVFSIVGLPYGGLVAVLAAVCSFIPYVGAFIACAVGAVLTLLESPFQALVCIVVYLAVQFVENQFIYPRVVGSSVGLAPLWTLMAVLLGGKLLGLVGMVFFIPLVSVFYTLLSDFVHEQLEKKGMELQ